jgi:hypothetical protein
MEIKNHELALSHTKFELAQVKGQLDDVSFERQQLKEKLAHPTPPPATRRLSAFLK